MRKSTMTIAALLLLLAVVVAGCGNSNSAPAGAASGAANSPAATAEGTPQGSAVGSQATSSASTGPQERTVATVNGDITIPAHPQRIVATYYVGELTALGMKPIGTVTRQLGEANPNLASYTDGMADIGASPNLEKITALDPDLIIATDFDEIAYDSYAKIAPTIVIPWSDDDVWAKLRMLAKLLGKEAEAEAYIKGYEDKAAKAREAIKGHVGADETVSVLMFNGKKIGVFGARDIGYSLYEGLKLTPPPAVKEKMQDPTFSSDWSVSMEAIPDFAADRIFVATYNEEGDNTYKELQKLSIWTSLPAVKNNKVYLVRADQWFTYDPISVGVTLDEAVRLLAADAS